MCKTLNGKKPNFTVFCKKFEVMWIILLLHLCQFTLLLTVIIPLVPSLNASNMRTFSCITWRFLSTFSPDIKAWWKLFHQPEIWQSLVWVSDQQKWEKWWSEVHSLPGTSGTLLFHVTFWTCCNVAPLGSSLCMKGLFSLYFIFFWNNNKKLFEKSIVCFTNGMLNQQSFT